MTEQCSSFIRLIIPVLLSLHVLMAVSATSAPNITGTDQSGLLSLKTRITSDPYGIFKNWNISSPVCNWTGVACGSRHLRVTALNLSDTGLTGEIPPQLGNLSFLVSLDISRNYFTGDIPHELARLRRLRFVEFSYNNFEGEVPPWFAFLPQVRVLSLGNNSFTSMNSFLDSLQISANETKLETLIIRFNFLRGNIPESIGDLRNLRFLHLRGNQLSGVIPSSLANMSSLETLILNENNIGGTIPEAIGNLGKLNWLNLQYNRLTGSLNIIFNISTLQVVDFSNNTLSGTLPDDMCLRLPKLKGLYLSYNKIHGQIPSSFDACPLLQSLSLSYNNFSGIIPPEIGNLQVLEELYLGINELSGIIPSEIGRLRSLQVLHMPANMLTGSIPSTLYNLSNLRYLTLADNKLSGSLTEEFGNLIMLVEAYLGYNNFTGKFPTNICNSLHNLEGLYLANNNFDGGLPNSISNCSELTKLDVSENTFTGAIPTSLGDLRHLEYLNLGMNYFTSESTELSFITSLTNCRNLTMLSFGSNLLNGILPSSLGNLSYSLQTFDASDCRINGYIPDEIGNFSRLVYLDLSGNNLYGVTPTTLNGLPNLQRLSLGYNQLSGSIPNSLCKNMGSLVLSHNQITGPAPECLGNISSLRMMYLESNNLTSIPDSIWGLQDILELDISSNSLTGSLSSQIGNLKVLTYLNMSMNHISGYLPNTFQGLQSLTHFSLAHNEFQGSIPDSISGMFALVSLDLSHNRLSGMIPKSLEALKYLEYFNVSFNELSGEIPSGGPFRNLTSQSFVSNPALCGLPRYQVSPCKESKKKSKMKKELMIPLVAALVFIGILALIIIRHFCRKNKRQIASDISLGTGLARISYYDLLRATNGFSYDNLLGRGSFGSVYKGTFRDETIFAIKVFNMQMEGGVLNNTFTAECEVLRNLRHRNLIKVITSCSNQDFKALVLEYMPNGSLNKWLYSKEEGLSLMQRLSIMIDVASALEYLHHGYSTSVVHCDVKPSNVLLDENMIAHISDFGIAKLLGEGESIIHTRTLATMGYMAPEYGLEGGVSTRCDVYSYGIMLLETFTRKSPTDDMFSGDMNLKTWVKDSAPNRLSQVIDADLMRPNEENISKEMNCLSSVLELALSCSEDSPGERMNMKEVVAELKKIMKRFMLSTKYQNEGSTTQRDCEWEFVKELL